MRLHRLRVQAFGAFAGTEEVRFDELDGLFLLHGETGAGKTTLLDAIAFALYGRVPGARGEAKRLRSDHAASDVRTEVQLEATVGRRRLRITRKPEQVRPRKSGTGFTTEPASILLEEMTAVGSWEGKSGRAGEADAEIRDLMGMSAEQFFQVVLLPQGQFARFLHSDAKDRTALLQSLFGTDRFERVEKWLAERRVATARDVEVASGAVDRLLNRVAQVAGVPVPEGAAGLPAWASPGEGAWQLSWAHGLLAAADAERETAAGLAATRGRDLAAATAVQAAAEQLADKQRRRAAALRRQAELTAEAPSIGALRAELDAAARAAEVASVLTAAASARQAAATAKAAADRARGAIPAELALARVDDLRAGARQEREKFGRLEGLRSVARQAAEEDEAALVARKREASLESDLETIQDRGLSLRQARPAAEAARDSASRAAAELPAAQAAADARTRVAGDLTALVKVRKDRARVAEAHRLAAATALALNRDYERIRKARIEGMSGELAKNLVDGSPCPVCGSADHPEPSEMPSSWVSPEEEKRAYEIAGEAVSKAEKASRDVAAKDAAIHDLTERLASAGTDAPEDLDALTAAARQAETDSGQASAEAASLSVLAAELSQRQGELEALDAQIADAAGRQLELAEKRTAALAEASGAEQRAADLRQALRAQLAEKADLETALAAATRLADVLTDAADAADAADREAGESRAAQDRAAMAASAAGFAGIEAAQSAVRDTRWRKETDEKIREHEASAEAVTQQLADPDLAVELEPAARTEAAREAVAAAQQEHNEAIAAQGRAELRAQQLAQLAPQLAEAVAAVEPLEAKAAAARHLADLANANGTVNQYKMTLSAFVLAARLEEVAAAASGRLVKMTAGRYTLAHTDSRKGAKKAGLGLLACDSWTGQDRDTSTLSGGETFLASLALALGLADVVTAEAAGTPMEALFVDEGFGTLDEDTLDEVMTVLDGLREGGRMVGIVSHVSELRQRIPARIHVRKGHHGSSVSVTAG
jgi:DNA repair protein SbcC/Rad50